MWAGKKPSRRIYVKIESGPLLIYTLIYIVKGRLISQDKLSARQLATGWQPLRVMVIFSKLLVALTGTSSKGHYAPLTRSSYLHHLLAPLTYTFY